MHLCLEFLEIEYNFKKWILSVKENCNNKHHMIITNIRIVKCLLLPNSSLDYPQSDFIVNNDHIHND